MDHPYPWGPCAEEPSGLTAGRPGVFGKQKLVFLTMDRFVLLGPGSDAEVRPRRAGRTKRALFMRTIKCLKGIRWMPWR